jgi:hypothetical protein
MKFFAIIGIVATVCAALLLLRFVAMKRGRSRDE